MLSLDLIYEAARQIRGHVYPTQVEESPVLSDLLGVPVWFKLENTQITGSFKARGALFAMKKAQERGLNRVATCSAGNHGKGVAWAAKVLGMQATVFVPQSVDPVKVQGMKKHGVDVCISEFDGYDETEAWAKSEAADRGLPFISAFDDHVVMAGNGGTVALEILEQVPGVLSVVLPVGGGGLSAGASFVLKNNPAAPVDVVLCQHQDSAAFYASVAKGSPVVTMPAIKTLASGLEGGFGVNTFEVLKTRFDHIQLVDEPSIRRAMVWMIGEHQWIVEGSAAAAVAACLNPTFPKPRGPMVIVLSGRNVALPTVANVLSQP